MSDCSRRHRACVVSAYGTEMIDQRRAQRMARCANARRIVRAHDGCIIRIELQNYTDHADDGGTRMSSGAQRLIHNFETATNPPRVWELKRAGWRIWDSQLAHVGQG
jgi:hypothetical protein